MLYRRFGRFCLMLVLASLVVGCSTGYVINNERSGSFFVKYQEPVMPIPQPVAVVSPNVIQLSVNQTNDKAIAVFTDKGFEAVKSEKGITVYLPPTIYFNDSETDIRLDTRIKIAEVAHELLQPYLSDRIVEVSGHTDSLGSKSINLVLSKKRSLAATAELVFSKVSTYRLSSTWFGETRLRAPDFNSDGTLNVRNRNLNRRVEFTILNPE